MLAFKDVFISTTQTLSRIFYAQTFTIYLILDDRYDTLIYKIDRFTKHLQGVDFTQKYNKGLTRCMALHIQCFLFVSTHMKLTCGSYNSM